MRKYGKKRAVVMIQAMQTLLEVSGPARDREQARDMVVDIFEAYNRLLAIAQLDATTPPPVTVIDEAFDPFLPFP